MKKDETILTTEDQLKKEAAEQKEAEQEADLMETAAEASALEDKAETMVYCGPSVRNVARQYTVYAGPIPEPLEKFMQKHPAARALLVPLDNFAETRRKLETKGTAETVLYKKVKSEL